MSIIPFSSGQDRTMSSLLIAEITGKEHANVMRDIRTTLEQAEIPALKFEGCYKGANGKDLPCYNLPRFECDLVVSGYSVKYRSAIIKRWHELEQQAFQIPSHAEALRLAADAIDERDSLKLVVAEQAPKVEFFDAVTASDSVVQMATAAQVAKLPFGRNTLMRKLREMGVLISGGGRHNLPKQEFIERGYFTVNEYKFERSSGEPDVSFTTHVTQKGIAWLVKTFGSKEGRVA